MGQILTATGNAVETIYEEWMDYEFRKSPTSIIPRAEDMWDIQERDGHCEFGTGHTPNP